MGICDAGCIARLRSALSIELAGKLNFRKMSRGEECNLLCNLLHKSKMAYQLMQVDMSYFQKPVTGARGMSPVFLKPYRHNIDIDIIQKQVLINDLLSCDFKNQPALPPTLLRFIIWCWVDVHVNLWKIRWSTNLSAPDTAQPSWILASRMPVHSTICLNGRYSHF